MERYRTLMVAAILAWSGPGCIHIHLDGESKDKLPKEIIQASATVSTPTPQAKATAKPQTNPNLPTSLLPSGLTGLSKLTGKSSSTKAQAVEMSVAWQNRIAYLPDPTRDGAMGAGIVGQLFLFGSNMQIATPEGPLTIELYDESPRSGRPPESVKLGRWSIDKETLKKFRLQDERWGPCYALFLPWPDYRADINRIRLTVKYEPEGGFPIFATPSTITIDTSAPGSNAPTPVVTTVVPAMQGGFGQTSIPMNPGMSPIGGPPPMSGGTPPSGMMPPPTVTQLPPVGPQQFAPQTVSSMPPSATPFSPVAPVSPSNTAVGGVGPESSLPIPTPMNGPGAPGASSGLQPIVITAGQRR